MSKFRRIAILVLTGIITLLLFSLLATYDYLYSYDRSTKPISYDREEYLEFYIQSRDRVAMDVGLDVTVGEAFEVNACMMNFLGSKRSLTLAFGSTLDGKEVYLSSENGQLDLSNSTFRLNLTIEDGQYREVRLSLVPGPDSRELFIAVMDGETVLAVRHVMLR